MKKLLFISLSLLLINSCTSNIKTDNDNIKIEKPLSILMYSANYNYRPSKSKIDTIIIHHTAPFASLTRVGYYFQDINSRVSSHYIIGKEGLIIESVKENERAWHAGYSSWKGKFNLNDYSIGIEVLNNGDNKDIWTEAQYNSLAKLTAYLMKKYDIKIERVIGHRDIGLPLGRKVDPADNFDWNLFKNKIRNYLNIVNSYYNDNPQEFNDNPNKLLKKLDSNNLQERIEAINSFLTIVKNTDYLSDIKKSFKNEEYSSILPYYYRFFSIYKDNSFIYNANEILNNYTKYPLNLFKSVLNYLYENDKDNLYLLSNKLLENKNIEEKYKIELLNIIALYNKNEAINTLVENYNLENDKDIKISILQSMSNIKKDNIKLFLLNELEKDNLMETQANIIDALRVNYDNIVEEKLINLLNHNISNSVLNSIAINLIRNKSNNGILKLQNNDLFNNLDKQNKLALINMSGILKISESWLISNAKLEIDRDLLSSYIIAISRFETKKGLNYLISEKFDDKELEFTRIKSLGYYNDEKVERLIKNILSSKEYSSEYKVLAISFINDKKLINLLPLLKVLYVENTDLSLETIIKNSINLLENNT